MEWPWPYIKCFDRCLEDPSLPDTNGIGTATPTRAPEWGQTEQISFETPTLPTPGHGSPPPKTGTQPVTDLFMETPTLPTPGHSSPPPRAGIQPVINRFMKTPTLPTPWHGRPPPRVGTQPVYNCCSLEQADMVDTVVWWWFEIDALYETWNLPTPEHSSPPPRTGTQPVNTFCSLLQADLDDAIVCASLRHLWFLFSRGHRRRPRRLRWFSPNRQHLNNYQSAFGNAEADDAVYGGTAVYGDTAPYGDTNSDTL